MMFCTAQKSKKSNSGITVSVFIEIVYFDS